MQLPEADVVVLRKVKRLAPDFHQHIVSSQMRGNMVQQGDRLLVYKVDKTVPNGPVMVSERTLVEFY